MEDLVGKTLGNYRLERILGRGRMGIVYLAHDLILLRPTAVKIMSWSERPKGQDPVKWFLSEARSVARINHPNVVQIYHIAKQDSLRYIAMEYVEGNSIDTIITKEGPFNAKQAYEVLCQTASALHAAHSCGIIHRDVKPANLLYSFNGVVKLSDFGMALRNSFLSSISTSALVGTPFFMAPELWLGSQATPASDIYSLGATYYYMLTGQYPFDARNIDDLREMHLDATPPDPRKLIPSIPSECYEIIRCCMAKKPSDRFESAQELDWMARGTLSIQDSIDNNHEAHCNQANRAIQNLIQSMMPRPAKGIISNVMGFIYEPFSAVDIHHVPYSGDPFPPIVNQLFMAFTQPSRIVLLKGLRGSGKTVLCCQAANKLNPNQTVIYVDTRTERLPSLLNAIRRIVGGLPGNTSNAKGELESLVERLRALCSTNNNLPVVIIVDNLIVENESIRSELKLLLRIAQLLNNVVLVLIGPPTLDRDLQKYNLFNEKTPIVNISIPSLDFLQTITYINNWIKYALDPSSSTLIVTPDAGLQVAHWSSGNMAWINRISLDMLLLAAYRKRRVISSWEAWTANIHQHLDKHIDTIDYLHPDIATQIADWPTDDALKIINECRRKVQFPIRGEIDVEQLLYNIGIACSS